MNKEKKMNDHLYYTSEPSDSNMVNDLPRVIGWKVKASNDEVIGTVNHLVISKETDKIVYLDVEIDKKLMQDVAQLHGKPESFSGGEFINKDDENNLIIPVGWISVNEDLKSVQTTEISYNTFTRTKRIQKEHPISREYELIILDTYKNNAGKESSDETHSNDSKNKETMDRSDTGTEKELAKNKDRNTSKSKKEKQQKITDKMNDVPGLEEADKKSKQENVTGNTRKENQTDKSSDNANITASTGEITNDSSNTGIEEFVKKRREKSINPIKDTTSSSKVRSIRDKSDAAEKKAKKKQTLKVPGGTYVPPTHRKETSTGSKGTSGRADTSEKTSGTAKSQSSERNSDSGSTTSPTSQKNTNSTSNKGAYITMDYHEHSKEELSRRAREIDLEGRSKMTKDELVRALYDSHTKEELYDRASEADISGRSKMSKTQLINALQRTNNDKSSSGKNSNKTSGTKSSSQSSPSGSNGSKNRSGSSTSGTDYHDLNKDELYEKAKQKDIEGRSQMSKEDLIKALYEDHTREDLYNKAARANIRGRSKMNKEKLINELQRS